jgi:chromosome segregation ATPase
MFERKTRAQQWSEQQMLNPMSPATPAPSFDEVLQAVGALANSPEAVRKEMAKLADRISVAKKAEATAKAAIAEQTAHHGKSLNEIDAKATARNAAIDARETEVTARLTAWEKGLTEREQSVAKREAEAEALLTKAREQHAAIRRKVDAYDAA